MDLLLDSNVLLFLADPRSPFHIAANTATRRSSLRGERLVVFPQNLIEFWAVATRPMSANGLGFSTTQASAEIVKIRNFFQLIAETPEIYDEWHRLVTDYQVSGKNVHDARLVAQMNVHGIRNILTFNVRDFTRFGNINPVAPEGV